MVSQLMSNYWDLSLGVVSSAFYRAILSVGLHLKLWFRDQQSQLGLVDKYRPRPQHRAAESQTLKVSLNFVPSILVTVIHCHL